MERLYVSMRNWQDIHNTVNPQQYFVGSLIKAYKHTIEDPWYFIKNQYKIKTKGLTNLLESHLMKEIWRFECQKYVLLMWLRLDSLLKQKFSGR